ncbi:hypothetical protein HK102_012944 [Quaeritorhiza haematococci]|nr:hypothetical protein HK102_012944 [Quaeritorhiza haematococci]
MLNQIYIGGDFPESTNNNIFSNFALYDFSFTAFMAIGKVAPTTPGPIKSMVSDGHGEMFISGIDASSNNTFVFRWSDDGSREDLPINPTSQINGLYVLPLREQMDDGRDNVVAIVGKIPIEGQGNVSAAFYDGKVVRPLIFTMRSPPANTTVNGTSSTNGLVTSDFAQSTIMDGFGYAFILQHPFMNKTKFSNQLSTLAIVMIAVSCVLVLVGGIVGVVCFALSKRSRDPHRHKWFSLTRAAKSSGGSGGGTSSLGIGYWSTDFGRFSQMTSRSTYLRNSTPASRSNVNSVVPVTSNTATPNPHRQTTHDPWGELPLPPLYDEFNRYSGYTTPATELSTVVDPTSSSSTESPSYDSIYVHEIGLPSRKATYEAHDSMPNGVVVNKSWLVDAYIPDIISRTFTNMSRSSPPNVDAKQYSVTAALVKAHLAGNSISMPHRLGSENPYASIVFPPPIPGLASSSSSPYPPPNLGVEPPADNLTIQTCSSGTTAVSSKGVNFAISTMTRLQTINDNTFGDGGESIPRTSPTEFESNDDHMHGSGGGGGGGGGWSGHGRGGRNGNGRGGRDGGCTTRPLSPQEQQFTDLVSILDSASIREDNQFSYDSGEYSATRRSNTIPKSSSTLTSVYNEYNGKVHNNSRTHTNDQEDHANHGTGGFAHGHRLGKRDSVLSSASAYKYKYTSSESGDMSFLRGRVIRANSSLYTVDPDETGMGMGGTLDRSRAESVICVATQAYRSDDPGELEFDAGARLIVIDDSDPNWWMGMVELDSGISEIGIFPSSCVTLERPHH